MKIFLSILFLFLSIHSLASDLSSLWALPQTWTTQDGKSIQLSALSGHSTIATMIFTSCPGACPLMVSDIKLIDKKLKPKEQKEMRYVLFSIDPKRDTPKALTAFAKKMKLDSRWTLLTSNALQVREMAALLGFQYKEFDDGDFTHSTTLFYINKKGELAAKRERNMDDAEFITKVQSEHLLAP